MNARYLLFAFLWVIGCSTLIDVDADFDEGGFSVNGAGAGGGDAGSGGTGSDTAGAGGAAGDGDAGAESEGGADTANGGSRPDAGAPGDGGRTSEPPTCSAETRLCSADGLLGSCAQGTQTCEDGVWGECSVSPEEEDTCAKAK